MSLLYTKAFRPKGPERGGQPTALLPGAGPAQAPPALLLPGAVPGLLPRGGGRPALQPLRSGTET